MGNERNHYNDECKEQAITLMVAGYSLGEVSRKMGIAKSTLSGWRDAHDEAARVWQEKQEKKMGVREDIPNEPNAVFDANRTVEQLRIERKNKLIEGMWEELELAQSLMTKKLQGAVKGDEELDKLFRMMLKKAEENDNELNVEEIEKAIKKIKRARTVTLRELYTLFSVVYDKQALANKEPTGIFEGTMSVKKLEDYDD